MLESLSAPQPSAGLSLSRKVHALHDLLSPSNMPKDTHTHSNALKQKKWPLTAHTAGLLFEGRRAGKGVGPQKSIYSTGQ